MLNNERSQDTFGLKSIINVQEQVLPDSYFMRYDASTLELADGRYTL